MKILWITIGILPPLAEKLGRKKRVTGGWVFSALTKVRELRPDFEFAVATLDVRGDLFHERIDGVDYYLIPEKSRQRYDCTLESYWRRVRDDFSPDVVHIHGTEQPHGLAYLNACGAENVVSSLQGLVHVIARHYLGGISIRDLVSSFSWKDFFRCRLLWMRKLAFWQRGIIEIQHLKTLKYAMGRTSWDKAHAGAVNPKLEYFQEERTLRPCFYSGRWRYQNCVPQSIFLSQAGYPVKGLHFLIKALPRIIEEFPKTHVFIGGENILNPQNGREGGYGKLCRKLMQERGIEDRFHFLGSLPAEDMKREYLRANVFVGPSTIENSPNSMCEAQILGTPLVVSDVGGVLDLVEHGKTGFVYRCEDIELLAHWICHVFRAEGKMDRFVEGMQSVAKKRHNEEENAQQLARIYEAIASKVVES